MGLNLDLSKVVIGAIIVFTIIRLLPPIQFIFRKKYLVSLIKKNNDIDLFLKEIEKDINKNNLKFKNDLLLDKVAALMVKGKLDETNKVLNTISQDKLSGNLRSLYYYYFIINLFETNRINEAKYEFVQHYNEISKLKRIERYKILADMLEAINLYFSKEIQRSRNLFLELLNKVIGNFNKAQIYYYLGLISRDMGRREEARKYFEKAKQCGEYTIIENKTNAQLNILD